MQLEVFLKAVFARLDDCTHDFLLRFSSCPCQTILTSNLADAYIQRLSASVLVAL
jgi:hypothetical protein